LILGIIDTGSKAAELIIVGDGFIHINGKHYEYEHDNKPDYIGYHLNMDKHLWYQTRTEKQSVNRIEDLTISTDGIHTFKNHDGKTYEKIEEEEILTRFFVDKSNSDNPNKLKKTLLKLKEHHGLMPSDDLTMIRVIDIE
ncbi:hypothetical protein N9L92_05655, partial [Saprospiraceae bacterium]|nr:hypothetical protein [Saprospiraceae bacterium]